MFAETHWKQRSQELAVCYHLLSGHGSAGLVSSTGQAFNLPERCPVCPSPPALPASFLDTIQVLHPAFPLQMGLLCHGVLAGHQMGRSTPGPLPGTGRSRWPYVPPWTLGCDPSLRLYWGFAETCEQLLASQTLGTGTGLRNSGALESLAFFMDALVNPHL